MILQSAKWWFNTYHNSWEAMSDERSAELEAAFKLFKDEVESDTFIGGDDATMFKRIWSLKKKTQTTLWWDSEKGMWKLAKVRSIKRLREC